jgi:hypothetical protein
MTDKPRYLTKSRFKIGSECPRKIHYLDHKDKYANQKAFNDFLTGV